MFHEISRNSVYFTLNIYPTTGSHLFESMQAISKDILSKCKSSDIICGKSEIIIKQIITYDALERLRVVHDNVCTLTAKAIEDQVYL
jgi:hypothetical protein